MHTKKIAKNMDFILTGGKVVLGCTRVTIIPDDVEDVQEAKDLNG